MNKNTIDPTKLPYKLGDIIYNDTFNCTGIIVGYYFMEGFNNYNGNSDYGYTVKRLDNKPGHIGGYYTFKANGDRLISKKHELWCIPAICEIKLKKSLSSFIFKLLRI